MIKQVLEGLKLFIFIATTAIGITLYVHKTFATVEKLSETVKKVKAIEDGQDKQSKILCIMAIDQGVARERLKEYCDLNL